MEITKEVHAGALCIVLSGELDHHTAQDVRTQIDGVLLRDDAIMELRLDLRGVTFMDSSGLGVILGRYRQMAERGGRVVLSGASRYAERILKMAGIYALVKKGGNDDDQE